MSGRRKRLAEQVGDLAARKLCEVNSRPSMVRILREVYLSLQGAGPCERCGSRKHDACPECGISPLCSTECEGCGACSFCCTCSEAAS